MTTTGFFLHCWKSKRLSKALQALQCLLAVFILAIPAIVQAEAVKTEILQLELERQADGLYLSAALQFELSPVIEDALQKGIPMFFVSEADIYRGRWYWYDKKIASAERHIRLAYQPLTRRWRITVSSGVIGGTGFGLNQNFDSLAEATVAVKRLSRWKIADSADYELDQKLNLDFRFRMDLTQLPRPFQIGALGQSDWNISAAVVRPVVLGVPNLK